MIEITKKIINYYQEADFKIVRTEPDYLRFENKFSIHYVFLCGKTITGIENTKSRLEKFNEIFLDDYTTSSYHNSVYWNYYAIFIFELEAGEDDSAFNKIKQDIEKDRNMSRKFVLKTEDLNELPPLYFRPIKTISVEKESFWEIGWRNATGEELYDSIVESSKNQISTILDGFIDDKINRNK